MKIREMLRTNRKRGIALGSSKKVGKFKWFILSG
jgi:hypothetical protein